MQRPLWSHDLGLASRRGRLESLKQVDSEGDLARHVGQLDLLTIRKGGNRNTQVPARRAAVKDISEVVTGFSSLQTRRRQGNYSLIVIYDAMLHRRKQGQLKETTRKRERKRAASSSSQGRNENTSSSRGRRSSYIAEGASRLEKDKLYPLPQDGQTDVKSHY